MENPQEFKSHPHICVLSKISQYHTAIPPSLAAYSSIQFSQATMGSADLLLTVHFCKHLSFLPLTKF